MSDALQTPTTDTQVPQRHADPTGGQGDSLLTGPQVRQRLGISRSTLRSWILAGVAPAPVPDLPGHPRWTLESIEGFERRKHGTAGGEYFGAVRRGR